MTRLKARQERFCRRFVELANAALAARSAGYTPQTARNAGYRLLKYPRISQRIAELQSELAERHCGGTAVLIGKLEIVYRRAIDNHQFSAAARAVELQAKLTVGGAALRSPRRSPGHVAANDDDAPPA